MSSPDFNKSVVDTLAKRAGYYCSNPDCGVFTVGPNEAASKATIIGEAAHIYGSRNGSARFDTGMKDVERGDITNGIWLCRNCHKDIDSNPIKYPAELLFEWRRAHEIAIYEKLGQQSELLRLKSLSPTLSLFEDSSPLANQIVIDKPIGWECKLTAELLRGHLDKVRKRQRSLRDGLYSKEMNVVPLDDVAAWQSSKFAELVNIVGNIEKLVVSEIPKAWGPLGQPGDASEIHRVCSLIYEACQRCLEWEESVRFAHLGEEFNETKVILYELTENFIQQVERVPEEIFSIEDWERPGETRTILLEFETPKNFSDRYKKSLDRAVDKVVLNIEEEEKKEESSGGCGTLIFCFVVVIVIFAIFL